MHVSISRVYTRYASKILLGYMIYTDITPAVKSLKEKYDTKVKIHI